MLRLARRVAIVVVIVCFSMIKPTGSAYCDAIVAGGLDEPESGYSLGPNLLVNGDLRSGLQGWALNPSCFSLDGSGNSATLRLQEPCSQPFPSAQNDLKCSPGLYTISAEIKTQTTIPPQKRGGSRVRLLEIPANKWSVTQPVVGTADWTPVTKAHAEVAEGSIGSFRAETVGRVAGISWFRRFSVQRELPAPLETFLLYPNYRGMLFNDQSQIARVAIDVNPPSDTTLAKLSVVLEAIDSSGKVLLTVRQSPKGNSTVVNMNLGPLPLGQYRLQGSLEGPGDKRLFTQSSYTIVKVAAAIAPR